MITLVKTDSDSPDFVALIKMLDADLAVRDGGDHSFYAQFNKINKIKHTIVAYQNHIAVGCGAIKEYSADSMEIKRMYTLPNNRSQGISTKILAALEQWAVTLGYKKCVLETGRRQPEAIGLYKKNGYRITPNYGQYIGIENSVCFEKMVAI